MKPKVQLIYLILIALSLSGWLMWLGERNRAKTENETDAFKALEQQAQELHSHIEQLEQALTKAKQGSSGELAIPTSVTGSLEQTWSNHPDLPDLHFADDPAIFSSNLQQLRKLIPPSPFTKLLVRCGIIESHESFLKQLALSRSEGSRAIAGAEHILLASDFDAESIPDQAELLSAIQLFWLQQKNPNTLKGNRALQFDLTLRACAQLEKTDFLLRFARRGDAMMPNNGASITPIEELPLAIRACIHWQAQQQLRINTNLKNALRKGDPKSYISPRQGLGPIFTSYLLNPSSQQEFSGKITQEKLNSSTKGTLQWSLSFATSSQADAANHALSLYFSDWPPAFGSAPAISQKSEQINLSF